MQYPLRCHCHCFTSAFHISNYNDVVGAALAEYDLAAGFFATQMPVYILWVQLPIRMCLQVMHMERFAHVSCLVYIM